MLRVFRSVSSVPLHNNIGIQYRLSGSTADFWGTVAHRQHGFAESKDPCTSLHEFDDARVSKENGWRVTPNDGNGRWWSREIVGDGLPRRGTTGVAPMQQTCLPWHGQACCLFLHKSWMTVVQASAW